MNEEKTTQWRNLAWIKILFPEPVSRLWAYIFVYIFHSKAPYWDVTDSLWFQGRIKKMVREIHKLLWYCQKEKWQYYMLKGFPDSCDRLSLKVEKCFAESLIQFAMQNLPIGKHGTVKSTKCFFYTVQPIPFILLQSTCKWYATLLTVI